jgi:hypothetical protein
VHADATLGEHAMVQVPATQLLSPRQSALRLQAWSQLVVVSDTLGPSRVVEQAASAHASRAHGKNGERGFGALDELLDMVIPRRI